jgi:hypothetical protein
LGRSGFVFALTETSDQGRQFVEKVTKGKERIKKNHEKNINHRRNRIVRAGICFQSDRPFFQSQEVGGIQPG